nr:integrase, catalytic region, zinc finger, CCHC-type, peptidase aspartic, catalytic [Tanacetum cinerariifolium]
MARQCPKPKRKRDATWFRDKVLLAEAQESGKVLNEEELEFLADPRVAEAKAVLMANLSSYGSDVLSDVPYSDNTHNDMLNQSMQEMPYSKQTYLVNYPENEITNFGKRFVPQQELSDEQAFRLQTSHPNINESASSLVKIEAPRSFLRMAKLIAKNEHLKQTYKQLYDSIKPSRVRSKEHDESLVNQLNQKSVEISDLNAQLQEKVFVITALKNVFRKFKGKDIVDNTAQVLNATTIALGMYKLDPVTLAPKDKNNRETHIYHLKHIIKQATILREIVEQAKSLNPLDSASYSACKYVKLIKELLGYVRDPCPDIHKPSEKLVVVTPINKKKTVRRPKVPKTNGSNSKPKIAKSVISNNMEPGTCRGSNTSVAPSSSSLIDLRTRASIIDSTTSSSRLVSNHISQQPCNPPPRDNWDRLFQHMFDEYFNPSIIDVSPVPVANAPRAVELADSPMSTSIDQDALSTSIPSTQDQEHSLIISQGFEESSKTPYFHDDPLHESFHEDSTSQGSSSNVRLIHTLFESLCRWSKDHPIANVIGDPSHSVYTRKQLQTDVRWCYFDAFLTLVEPKNFKQAMTKPSWIDAMQEEIHEFERLQV